MSSASPIPLPQSVKELCKDEVWNGSCTRSLSSPLGVQLYTEEAAPCVYICTLKKLPLGCTVVRLRNWFWPEPTKPQQLTVL